MAIPSAIKITKDGVQYINNIETVTVLTQKNQGV